MGEWADTAAAAGAIGIPLLGAIALVFRKAVRTNIKVEALESGHTDNAKDIERLDQEQKRQDREIAEVRTIASVALDRTDRTDWQ